MTESGLAFFFCLVVIYALTAHKLSRFSITMPLVFVGLGALFGADALGWIPFSIEARSVELVTEITLALLLFADASTLNFRQVRDDAGFPARLLFLALPLIVMLGAFCAWLLFPQQGIGFALLVAAILAPTDAALGMAVFNNPRVPVRIRRALNVESGLNDGIASPLVTLFIAVNIEEQSSQGGFLASAFSEIGIGIVIGVLLGLAGGWLFRLAAEKDWTSVTARQIGNPALALSIFLAAKSLHANGFVAIFIAGLFFSYTSRHKLHEATEYTEITGTFLSLFVWTIFGGTLVIGLIQQFDLRAFIYALLSLTLVRMLPVFLALRGTRLRLDTTLMMGWLGPRGLASVVFLVMAYESAHSAHLETNTLMHVGGWTILLSVILHGLSALPLASWYARRLERAPADAPEFLEVNELSLMRRKPISWQIHHR